MTLQFGHKGWFTFIISILLIADLTILLNTPFLRQIIGFLFLTFLPGLLILRILKLDKIESTEKLVLSVGLSITFLMLFGLLINYLSLSLGYETPLATVSILISFNIAFVVLASMGYKRNENSTFSLPNFNLSTSEKAFLIVPILFPALSIFGTYIMKTAENNSILMLLLFLIPIYVCFVCFFNHKFSKRLYPAVIFLISVSLLLIFMLRFPHICGHDVHIEYGIFFQTTLDKLHWSVSEHSTLDACLSISLLPTIFQSIMNVNAQEYLFKGIYVSICSFGPLAIYVISRKYVDELYAFLASFFFISQYSFLKVAGSPRTQVAIFFAVLAVMVFFSDKIDPLKRRILFIVFILSMVISHYSTTYIFFVIILFTWSAMEILSRKNTLKIVKKSVTLTIVILFFAFIFFWYSQVTETAFNSGVTFVEETVINLNNFFIVESRATEELNPLVGQELAYPILSRVNWIVTWSTFSLIGIGVLTMFRRYKEMVALSNVKLKKPDFLKTKFEMEYLVMVLACSGLLVVIVGLPYVSITYSLHRVYSLAIIILSVCFVMGGITLSKHFFFLQKTLLLRKSLYGKNAPQKTCAKRKPWFFGKASFIKERFKGKNALQNPVRKRVNGGETSQVRAYLIIILILIPYFLFVTGAIYQICGAPQYILSSEGKGYDLEYVHDSESCASKWLAMNDEKRSRIYTPDAYARMALISQGEISQNRINVRLFSKHEKLKEGYIYLSYNNVVKGKLMVEDMPCNMTEYSDMFIGKSKIYDNSGSELYR